jgi:hypothetical protein
MRLEIVLVWALILCAGTRAIAQHSVCDFFKELRSFDLMAAGSPFEASFS